MIANDGHRIGRKVELYDPVAAMHSIARDPWVQTTVELASGKAATAVDIQRQYLNEARPFVESGDYPDWTHELLVHWSATLDQLQTDPARLGDRLDVYMKLQIFDHIINRAGMSWAMLRRALQALELLRRTVPDDHLLALLSSDEEFIGPQLAPLLGQLSSSREFCKTTCQHLRVATRLQALELNYHELGGQFDGILAASSVSSSIAPSDAVDHAMHHPPCGGRAEARARSIVEFQGQSWESDWTHLINPSAGQMIDLTDPFSNQRKIQCWDRHQPSSREHLELEEILAQVHAFTRPQTPRLP